VLLRNGHDLVAMKASSISVCFVIDSLNRGGTELQLLLLMKGLDRVRVRPYLCLLDGEDDASRALEPPGVPVLRLGLKTFRSLATPRKAIEFIRFLRRAGIDIVEPHFPDSTRFAVPLARLAGVRHVVLTRRNLGHDMTRFDRLAMRVCQRLAALTIVNCESCRQAVVEQEGAKPESVVVIPNGIDLDPFLAIPSVGGNGIGRVRRIGMVANLRPVKGPDVFVEAAALVSQSHPNTTFHLAGTGDEESVRQLAVELGIQHRLHIEGRVEDVPGFLRKLDVAVLTSRSEGLSNALLEYMAAGRPIVATAVGANAELIEDGAHGLLVPPDDARAVASALDRLLRETRLSRELGESARSRVKAGYSHCAIAARYESVWTSLLSQRS